MIKITKKGILWLGAKKRNSMAKIKDPKNFIEVITIKCLLNLCIEISCTLAKYLNDTTLRVKKYKKMNGTRVK
jgi:hypothetical protein